MFKKKQTRRVRGSIAEIVPDEATACIDDVSVIEQAAHALEKALKRYAACRKDETDKVHRLVSVVPNQDGSEPAGGRAATPQKSNAGQWARVEENHGEMLESIALEPLRNFAKVFPEVNGVATGYFRAANDYKKAKDKLRQAELKGKDPHKAAQVLKVAEAEFDKLSNLVPHAFSELLKHRYDYFDEVVRGLLKANAIYFHRCVAIAEAIQEIEPPPPQSGVDVSGSTHELLTRIRDISIVGVSRKTEI
eukprot:m.433283 g.433283  ORF g.433283 m.433283 type:complete len:249 (+) comp17556_c0_seq1:3444-4190(+)